MAPSIKSDPASAVLLPLLSLRWPDALPENILAVSAEIAATLGEAGIDRVFLKGTVLIARLYPDLRLRATGDIDFQVPQD